MDSQNIENAMQEQWRQWKPIEGLVGLYDFKSLITNENGLCVKLSSGERDINHIVELTFKPCVDAFRQTTEGFRISLYHELSQNYDDNFYGNWTFFKVTNSAYVSWLIHESEAHAQNINCTHYSLMTDDSVLDIVSCYEPTVKIIVVSNN